MAKEFLMRYIYGYDLHIPSTISLFSNNPEGRNGFCSTHGNNHPQTSCLTNDFRDEIILLYVLPPFTGCRFYRGSDAHHPGAIDDPRTIFEHTIGWLGLTEEEKLFRYKQE